MGFKMKPKSPLTMKLVSALKHKPWSAAHKERPAHSATAEAHNAVPAAPTKKKEKGAFYSSEKKTERKLNRINRKMQKQHAKQDRNEDKGTKRGDRRADKAHAKGRKLLAKGRAIKKAADERTANLKKVGPPKESPAKLKKGKGVMIGGKEYPKGYTKKDVAFLKKQKEDVVRYEDLDAKGKAIYDAKRKKKKSPAKLKEPRTIKEPKSTDTRPTPKKKRRPQPARPKRQLGTGAKGLPSSEYLKKSSSGQGPRSKNYNLNRIPYGK